MTDRPKSTITYQTFSKIKVRSRINFRASKQIRVDLKFPESFYSNFTSDFNNHNKATYK